MNQDDSVDKVTGLGWLPSVQSPTIGGILLLIEAGSRAETPTCPVNNKNCFPKSKADGV
jgi:hypothetical protein